MIAGITGATTRAHLARAALEGITWRVADVVDAVREVVPVQRLVVDGGLTNAPLLRELQAGAAGVQVAWSRSDATVRGAAGLAGVGAGLLELDALAGAPAELTDAPLPDRAARHAAWRAFVAGAGALG